MEFHAISRIAAPIASILREAIPARTALNPAAMLVSCQRIKTKREAAAVAA